MAFWNLRAATRTGFGHGEKGGNRRPELMRLGPLIVPTTKANL